MGVWKIQMGIGFIWLAMALMWVILTAAQLWTGDEYFHQLILTTLFSGLSAQAFNHASVMSKLEGGR